MAIKEVIISPSRHSLGSPGDLFMLNCSVNFSDNPLSSISDVALPTFMWFFGPNGNASLPSGATPMATVLSSNKVYTSTLQFSPLSQLHTGMYTCQPGAKTLERSANVTVICMHYNYNYNYYACVFDCFYFTL